MLQLILFTYITGVNSESFAGKLNLFGEYISKRKHECTNIINFQQYNMDKQIVNNIIYCRIRTFQNPSRIKKLKYHKLISVSDPTSD